MPSPIQLVLSTCPTDAAESLARGLLENHLAACVNIVPAVRSLYHWQGSIQDEAESLLIIKTTAAKLEELFAWLAAQHPYTVPEIISLPSDTVLPAYAQWVLDQTQLPTKP